MIATQKAKASSKLLVRMLRLPPGFRFRCSEATEEVGDVKELRHEGDKASPRSDCA